MFAGFTTHRIATPDAEIHCRVGGSGPALLLLHGYPQNHWMWAHVAPLLARHFTVVCTDLRGYGASSKPQGVADHSNYAFRALAHDQVAVMQALGFPQFHVVGHDRGGRTAYRLALDHPGCVRALAVLDIVPTDVMFEQVDARLARAYWHWYFLQQPAPYPERVIGADPTPSTKGACSAGAQPVPTASTRRCSPTIARHGVTLP